MGAATVALIGLLARRVAGDRAGLVAAAIAAVYPPLWMLDASLRSESLYAPLIALVLLLAYRLRDLTLSDPTPRDATPRDAAPRDAAPRDAAPRAVALGRWLAALTRSERSRSSSCSGRVPGCCRAARACAPDCRRAAALSSSRRGSRATGSCSTGRRRSRPTRAGC